MAKLIYQQSDLPSFEGEYMTQLAQHLWQTKLYWHDARRPLEMKWRECDEAYLCYRRLPDSRGMDWVDDSEFGETDIFDNVNLLSIRMSIALMPRDYRWLTASSPVNEPAEVTEAVMDQQIYMHRKARTRRQFSRVIKQDIVRGTTALIWDWRENVRYRRLTTNETKTEFRKYLKASGMDPKDVSKVTRARIPETTFSGPKMRPLDVFDLWIDPHLDLTNTPYPATIVQSFHFQPDLEAAVDENDQPLYSNLEGLNPFSVEQIYAWDNNFRMRSPEVIGVFPMFGLYPARITGFTKLVPVYVFHFPYLKFKDQEFFDTYFHVALNNGFKAPRIIRIEENPSDSGHSHVLIDNYIDWYTNIGWGISGVEKSLTYLRQKNLLQAITMNAAAATTFPAQLIYSEAFRDDQEVNFAPGALNEVSHTPLGLKVVENVPSPGTGLQLGLQELRFWGDEIRAKMGVNVLTAEAPTRSVSKEKTATEVNNDATVGNTMLDDLIEKKSDMLTEYCQGAFEASRKFLKGDTKGNLKYETFLIDRVKQMSLKYKDLDIDRTIQVNGYLGALNKAQEMQHKIQALQLTEGVAKALPNAQPTIQKLWVSILEGLNIPVDPKDLLSNEQLAANDPMLQLKILQNATQNPQVLQAMMQQAHQARQIAYDQAQMQGAPTDVQASEASGNSAAETVPAQGF